MKQFLYFTFAFGLFLTGWAQVEVSVKELIIGENVKSYKAEEFNGDGKTDIIYLKDNGDVRGAIQKEEDVDGSITSQIDLVTGESVKEFEIKKFNSDNRTDIIFLTDNGNVKVALQRRDYTPVFVASGDIDWDYISTGSASVVYNESFSGYRFRGTGTAEMQLGDNVIIDISNLEEPYLYFESRMNDPSPSLVIEAKDVNGSDWQEIYRNEVYEGNNWRHAEASLVSLKESGAAQIELKLTASFTAGYTYDLRNIEVRDKYEAPVLSGDHDLAFENDEWVADDRWSFNDGVMTVTGAAKDLTTEYNYAFNINALQDPFLEWEEKLYFPSHDSSSNVIIEIAPTEDGPWEPFYHEYLNSQEWRTKSKSLLEYRDRGNSIVNIRIIFKTNAGYSASFRNFKVFDRPIQEQSNNQLFSFSETEWRLEDRWSVNGSTATITGAAKSQFAEYDNYYSIEGMVDPFLRWEENLYSQSNNASTNIVIEAATDRDGPWEAIYVEYENSQQWRRKEISLLPYLNASETKLHFRVLFKSNAGYSVSLRNLEVFDRPPVFQSASSEVEFLASNWELEDRWSISGTTIKITGAASDQYAEYLPYFKIGDMVDPYLNWEENLYSPSHSSTDVVVQIAPDRDGPWENIYTEYVNSQQWRKEEVSLLSFKQSGYDEVHFRFLFKSNAGYSVSFRNIEVIDRPLPQVSETSEFEYDASDWELEDRWSISGTEIKITGGAFNQYAEYLPYFNIGEMADPFINWEENLYSPSNSSTNITVQISQDRDGPWEDIYTEEMNSQQWRRKEVSLLSYQQSGYDEVYFRFLFKSNAGYSVSFRNINVFDRLPVEEASSPSFEFSENNWELEDRWSINTTSETISITGSASDQYAEYLPQYKISNLNDPYLIWEENLYSPSNASTNVTVQISQDRDGPWVTVHLAEENSQQWRRRQVSLLTFKQTGYDELHIRFLFKSNAGYSVSVRNIELIDRPVEIESLVEDFEISSTKWELEDRWSLNTTSETLSITGAASSQYAQYIDYFDILGYTNPYIEWEENLYSPSNSSTNITIEISPSRDGPWQTIYTEEQNSQTFESKEFSLSSYLNSGSNRVNLRFLFKTNAGYSYSVRNIKVYDRP